MTDEEKRKEDEAKRKPDADVDYWRQFDLFNPHQFTEEVTLIGVGATGSYVTLLLAKMGCAKMSIWDPDVVENYNLPNQVFGRSHVGMTKVAACAEMIKSLTNIEVVPHAARFEKEKLKGVVFLLTDTMSSRKAIWDSSIRLNPNVRLLVETRMGAESGRVYALNPTLPRLVKEYEKTLYSDEDAEESPCTRRSISPTVGVIAGYAAFTLVSYARGASYPNEVIVSLQPTMTLTKSW